MVAGKEPVSDPQDEAAARQLVHSMILPQCVEEHYSEDGFHAAEGHSPHCHGSTKRVMEALRSAREAAQEAPRETPAAPPVQIVQELLGRVMMCVFQESLEGAKAEFAAWRVVFPFGEPVAEPTGKMQWINRADFLPRGAPAGSSGGVMSGMRADVAGEAPREKCPHCNQKITLLACPWCLGKIPPRDGEAPRAGVGEQGKGKMSEVVEHDRWCVSFYSGPKGPYPCNCSYFSRTGFSAAEPVKVERADPPLRVKVVGGSGQEAQAEVNADFTPTVADPVVADVDVCGRPHDHKNIAEAIACQKGADAPSAEERARSMCDELHGWYDGQGWHHDDVRCVCGFLIHQLRAAEAAARREGEEAGREAEAARWAASLQRGSR